MLLYGIYRNAKPVLELEKKQLPEHMVTIVVLGTPDAVHPVDAKIGGTDHNEKEHEQADHNT